jgi:hypothetical protein
MRSQRPDRQSTFIRNSTCPVANRPSILRKMFAEWTGHIMVETRLASPGNTVAL